MILWEWERMWQWKWERPRGREWQKAGAGRVCATLNPATGDTLATTRIDKIHPIRGRWPLPLTLPLPLPLPHPLPLPLPLP
jgi:hypothetical protein